MRKKLPYFVTDPNNRAKVEALLSGSENPKGALGGETTQKLTALTTSRLAFKQV